MCISDAVLSFSSRLTRQDFDYLQPDSLNAEFVIESNDYSGVLLPKIDLTELRK